MTKSYESPDCLEYSAYFVSADDYLLYGSNGKSQKFRLKGWTNAVAPITRGRCFEKKVIKAYGLQPDGYYTLHAKFINN